MANPSGPDGIVDDFFEQIFAYGGGGAGGAGGGVVGGAQDGVLGGNEEGNFAGMVLQLSSGEAGQVGSGGGGGDHGGGGGGGVDGGGYLGGGGVFPLGLSLEQGGGGVGYGKAEDGSSGGKLFRGDMADSGKSASAKAELASLFPAFGHVHAHQIRPNPPHPPPQQFHGQASPGTVGVVQHPPAPRPRVRARRGQATDPHSIAERLRRERIAERMRALQELVPNSNKTDRAAMLDEIVDYVKFLRLQVKVLSMSRLGGAGAVAQLVADIPLPSVEGAANEGRGGNQQIWEKWSSDGTEQQVAKLMEEDIGAAMQFLQSKALCIMPVSLAATIYHTPHQPELPSLIKPEPNAPL